MEPIEAIEKKTPEEQAEISAYRVPCDSSPGKGELYIPATCLRASLVAAATYSTGKRGATLRKTADASLFVSPEYLGLGTSKFIVDARPVRIKATGGRIIRFRPRLDEWSVRFTVEYDETLMKESTIREIVDNAGKRVGVLDFRPAFGRFIVVEWQV
jgi:hypothetical protein